MFFRVVLPQLRLAILGGGLLIGVHLLAEFGAFAMVRFDTFTVAIFQQFQVTFDGAAGSMLAGVLVLLCLVLLIAEAAARGSARFAQYRRRRTAGGDADPPGPQHVPASAGPCRAGGAGARCTGVDDPALAVDRRSRGLGARRHRPARSAKPSGWRRRPRR